MFAHSKRSIILNAPPINQSSGTHDLFDVLKTIQHSNSYRSVRYLLYMRQSDSTKLKFIRGPSLHILFPHFTREYSSHRAPGLTIFCARGKGHISPYVRQTAKATHVKCSGRGAAAHRHKTRVIRV